MADAVSIPELIALLRQLDRLHGTARTKFARPPGDETRLVEIAKATIQAAADQGVWEATRGATYEEVAAALGCHIGTVGKAQQRYRRRHPDTDSELKSPGPARGGRRKV